jgi:succinate dehydrogenase/fumarate reductase-like Fe-S protein
VQGPKQNENVSINGKDVKAIVGQKVSVVAAQSRVKISYNCKAGDCGTCNIKMNGRTVKACQQLIPAGKCNIQTL